MRNVGLFVVAVGISLAMFVISEDATAEKIFNGIHNIFLLWPVVAVLGYAYFYFLVKIGADLWQENTFRE